MPNGGFVVRFNGQQVARCYAISFDYDHWHYIVNNDAPKELPPDLESIAVEVEEE